MKEYIEKSKIIEALENQKNKFAFVSADVLIDAIKKIESADVIDELIRCKDCIHYNNAADECLIEGYGINRPEDWFCGDGDRREE